MLEICAKLLKITYVVIWMEPLRKLLNELLVFFHIMLHGIIKDVITVIDIILHRASGLLVITM